MYLHPLTLTDLVLKIRLTLEKVILLANGLRSKGMEVFEEVHCVAENDSNRRIDIISIDKSKREAEIIDPTIRFETSNSQPEEVNVEKKNIYEPTIPYFLTKYDVNKIIVTGLFFGARGTIAKDFVKWRGKYKLEKDIQTQIVTTIIKYSVAILRNHLYGAPQYLNNLPP